MGVISQADADRFNPDGALRDRSSDAKPDKFDTVVRPGASRTEGRLSVPIPANLPERDLGLAIPEIDHFPSGAPSERSTNPRVQNPLNGFKQHASSQCHPRHSL